MSNQGNMTTLDKEMLDSISSDFYITKKRIYLNNGSISPLPISSIKSMTDFNIRYSEVGPDSKEFTDYLDKLKLETRKRVADLINGHEDEIIFTQSTTEGINMVANGLSWKVDDRLLIRNPLNEHFSNYLPWIRLSTDKNLQVRNFPEEKIESYGNSLIENFTSIYEKSTFKLVSTSHVIYNDGSITPVEEIGNIIKKRNKDTIFSIDGAQSVGAMITDVKKMKCDFLTFPSFKWLCGPLGVGILYVKKQVMEDLNPMFIGSGTAELVSVKNINSKGDKSKKSKESTKYHKYPEKYHATFRNFPGLAGLEASLRYLLRVGIQNIFQHNKYLASILRQELMKINDLTLHEATTEEFRSSLVSFSFRKQNNSRIQKLNARLQQEGVILAEREIGAKKILRASPHFYNSEDEMVRTANSIKSLIQVLD
ncbi:aminotransferase class V-fold PLP-dependent enzyme [Candidatus Nitrosocosmicus arcticus]|uniref:Putative cysteine desulfurase n=1 Tax=Candidatus Nitrosocosmicus arcticus TaxID=2035267 RepID=A0A557SYU6_9ARCH|nr:aminotransferase class V-fold PLP-dependent enzyme [Candidatus Nitrosocosmicus arcticus]TVP41778.1 putative cysteine desulfurase [Candidatus Nitrosocosmicus arcticus]